MSTPAEQQQALDELQTPASLDRITRFLSDLGAQGNTPLGTSGLSAQAFAASLAGGAHSFSARQTSGWVAILMDRYQIKIGEIQEFALWFVRRQEILSQTIDLVERAPEPVLARSQAPAPVLARPSATERAAGAVQADRMGETPAAADSPSQANLTQASPSAPPQRAALRRQAVTALPATLPPSEGGSGWEADEAGPAGSEERPRRRQDGLARLAAGSPRSRRIERGPVTARDDAPSSDLSQKDTPTPGMPEEDAPPARPPFRLMPHMITRPAFVTNVGLAGMLAGLSLAPSSAMGQDAPDMALAFPQVPGSGLMGDSLPIFPPFVGAGPMGGPPTMSPAPRVIAPLGAPVFTPTVTPLVSSAAPPPSTVWLGMPASAPPLPGDAAAPGAMASPLTQAASTPGVVPPTPPAPDMTFLLGVSPETMGVQAAPAFQAVGAQPPVFSFTPQRGAPGLLPDVSASPLPPVVPPAPTTTSPDAALPSPAPQPPALMGLAAGSAALAAAELLQAHQPRAASGDAGATPTGAGLPMPLATPPLPADSPPAASQQASPAPALVGLTAGSAALAVADRLRSPQSRSALDEAQSYPAGVGPSSLNTSPSPMTVFLGNKSGPAAPDGTLAADAPSREMPAPASPFAVTPEMGQITLMSPPLQIASAQAERGGIAASVDWQTLASGAGPLDEGGLARLRQALPVQASVLYPALPPGSLGQGAVNLPLSAPLVQSLLQKGYGIPGMGLATRAADMGASAGGGKPPAAPLPAQIVPGHRPAGVAAGLLGHPDEVQGGAGALGQAGKGQATRGGVLDFLGLPVRLAPSLGGRSDLARETTLRNAGQGPVKPQQTLRPEQFTPLRNRLFPAFSSMAVEPDKAAWRKAAPAFGLRDGSLTTLFAPDARVPVQTPTMPQPPSHSRPPVSSPSVVLLGGPHTASLLPPSVAIARHTASTIPDHIGTPSAFTPSALFTHGLLPAIGARTAARTPLQTLGGTRTASAYGLSLPFVAPHAPAHGPHGSPLAGSLHAPTSSGPGLGLIDSTGHYLPSGASLHHPFGHMPSPSGHTPLFPGAAHPPPGLTHQGTMPGSLPGHGSFSGMGSLAQNHLTTPRSHGGALSLPAAPGAGFHAGFHAGRGQHTTLPMALPVSGAFVPRKGHSIGHSQPGHTNTRPSGGHLSLPASHPVPASSLFLRNAHGSPRGHGGGGGRRSTPLFSAGLHPAALALPHRAETPMRFPDAHVISPHGSTSPVTARAVWPVGLPPTGRRQKGMGVTGSFGGPAPAMRLAPPRSGRRVGADASAPTPMTIQRSETTTTATPAQNRSAQPHAKPPSGPSGSVAGEVNALAGEVWSLLKRRLATEAERRGR